jgi:tetratricopeptide (TPR) repeat protein
MANVSPIDPEQFVALVTPLLEGQNLAALVDLLKSRFTPAQIISLFDSDNADARKVSAFAFGLVGQTCGVHKLAPLLKDPDPMVHQMAEHALWSLWFRSGTPEANHEVCRGTKALNRRDFEHALTHFNRAVDKDPSFAEAYNQRAIVHYLLERFEDSIEDCHRAVSRMPCHFGAWAGMGHCYAHLGKPAEAIRSYEKALEINPRLEGVRQGIEELREKSSGA